MAEDELLREVDEALRQDKLKKQWQAVAPLITGVVAAVIIGVGGTQLWGYYQMQQAAKASELYYKAVEAKASGDAEAATSLLKNVTHDGMAILASLQLVSEDTDLPSDHELVRGTKAVLQPSDTPSSHLFSLHEKEQLAMKYYAGGEYEKAYHLLQELNDEAGSNPSQMERLASLINAVEMMHPELAENDASVEEAGE